MIGWHEQTADSWTLPYQTPTNASVGPGVPSSTSTGSGLPHFEPADAGHLNAQHDQISVEYFQYSPSSFVAGEALATCRFGPNFNPSWGTPCRRRPLAA
jgi:hypothetical protein